MNDVTTKMVGPVLSGFSPRNPGRTSSLSSLSPARNDSSVQSATGIRTRVNKMNPGLGQDLLSYQIDFAYINRARYVGGCRKQCELLCARPMRCRRHRQTVTRTRVCKQTHVYWKMPVSETRSRRAKPKSGKYRGTVPRDFPHLRFAIRPTEADVAPRTPNG